VAENVIELNGKRYDALTGAYLGAGHAPAAAPAKHAKGRVIDGFIRPTATNAHVTPIPKKSAAAHTATAPNPVSKPKSITKPSTATARPSTAPHPVTVAKAHQPERAKTLMRRSVRKPEAVMKPAIKPQAPAEIAAKPVSAIVPKRSALQVDPQRLERAQTTVKHTGVRRFQPAKPDHSPAAMQHSPTTATHNAHVPVIAVRPAPEHHTGKSPTPHAHTDIFEAAIARANSHKQQPHKPLHKIRRRRFINIAAGIAAFFVIGGFVTYLNMPNIQLHIASMQAGFKADMPRFKPNGYALQGGVQRSGNTVTMTFQSGENNFSLTQQPSDWNSQTLLENTFALQSSQHKTVEAAGRTVYIYDDSNATWVDGGVRYDVTGNAPLSTNDITNLASSL
jgi:hypothetical protein